MAWIVKQSAGTQIERRDEPYLTEPMKADLEEKVLSRYPTRRAATLPVLHAIQHEHNWIPYQAIEETADFLDVSAAEVLDTATFYEEFFLKPKGKYLVQLCQSISCELMGNVPLLEKVQEKLGILPGETTDDDKFTLMTVECLGSCGTAPCGLVEGKLFEDIDAEAFMKMLDELE